jgi:hypothetical protein
MPFMQGEDPLPCSQESGTGPYFKPDESCPYSRTLFP